jgi:hypothetical protein
MNEDIMNEFKIFDRDAELGIDSLRDLVVDDGCALLLEKMSRSNFFDDYLNNNFKELGQKSYNPVDLLSIKIQGCINGVFSDLGVCRRIGNFGSERFLAGGMGINPKTMGILKTKHLFLISSALQWGIGVAEDVQLIDGDVFYLDGVKFRSNTNSMKNVFFSDISALKLAKLDKNFFKLDNLMDYGEYNEKLNLEALGYDEDYFNATIVRLSRKYYLLSENRADNVLNAESVLLEHINESIKSQLNHKIRHLIRISEERVYKNSELNYSRDEIGYFIIKSHLDYYKKVTTKFLNQISTNPLDQTLKEYIKKTIFTHMENKLNSLNITLSDDKFLEMKNKLKSINIRSVRNNLKYMMRKAMNISVSYNDNEAKWMLIKNATGFSIGNNIYRGYNLQVLRDKNGMIIAYGTFQDPTDHYTLITVIEELKKTRTVKSLTIVCDNMYNTIANLAYCKEEKINLITPTMLMAREYKGYQAEINSSTKNHFKPSPDKIEFKCPNKHILNLKTKQKIGTEIIELPTKTIELTRYEWKFKTEKCNGCPHQKKCARNKDYKEITFKLTEVEMEHMIKMSKKENKKIYAERKHKIETVFGDWKHNDKFQQINTKTLEKAKYVCGLLVLSQNIQTLTKHLKNNPQYKHILDKETQINYSERHNKIVIQKISMPIHYINNKI